MQQYNTEKAQQIDLNSFINAGNEQNLALNIPSVDPKFDIKDVFTMLQTPFMSKLIGKPLPPAYFILEKLHDRTSRPFGEQESWEDFYEKEIFNFQNLLQLMFVLSTNWGESVTYSVHEFMNTEFIPELKRFYGFDLRATKIALSRFERLEEVNIIINQLAKSHWDAVYAEKTALSILCLFYNVMEKPSARKEFKPANLLKEEYRTVFIYQHSSIQFWMSDRFFNKNDVSIFTSFFSILYLYYQRTDFLDTSPVMAFTQPLLDIFDFGHAYKLKIVPEAELKRELMTRSGALNSFKIVDSMFMEVVPDAIAARISMYYKWSIVALKKVAKGVFDYILSVELERGDKATEVSHLAVNLESVEGTSTLVALLEALGEEPFERLDYYYGTNYSKREIFSRLLRVCRPSETDTERTLFSLVVESEITPERLVEMAVYAPQWLDIVEKCTGWEGLLSTAYFFHAHAGTIDNNLMRAIVERFSSISLDDLRNGAFDIAWYRSARTRIGDERFEHVFNASRCVLVAGEPVRLRKNMDTVDGKENAAELIEAINQNRNKDLLLSYCLVPTLKRPKAEMLLRYKYLQQYEFESKSFSSQRQDAERKAVQMGLINLAKVAGYQYTHHFVWDMETSMIKLIAPYFKPVEIEDIKVSLKINEQGLPELRFVKDNRGMLHNIPSKLRKHEYVATLKAVAKKVKGLSLLSPETLETSMCEGHVFDLYQLQKWLRHPILRSMIKKIAIQSVKGDVGFVCSKGIQTIDGEVLLRGPGSRIMIAHPLQLHRTEKLEALRDYINSAGITQPFEQVNRKFFIPTQKEITLKTPYTKDFLWQPDGTGGRQRVFHEANIIAIADIKGALKLYDLKTFELLDPPDNVSDIIFSEIMRDLSKFELILFP